MAATSALESVARCRCLPEAWDRRYVSDAKGWFLRRCAETGDGAFGVLKAGGVGAHGLPRPAMHADEASSAYRRDTPSPAVQSLERHACGTVVAKRHAADENKAEPTRLATLMVQVPDAAQRMRRLWWDESKAPPTTPTTTGVGRPPLAPECLGDVTYADVSPGVHRLTVDGSAAPGYHMDKPTDWENRIRTGAAHLGLVSPLRDLIATTQNRAHLGPTELSEVWTNRLPKGLPDPLPLPTPATPDDGIAAHAAPADLVAEDRTPRSTDAPADMPFSREAEAASPAARNQGQEHLDAFFESPAVRCLRDSEAHDPSTGFGTARIIVGRLLAGLANLPSAPGFPESGIADTLKELTLLAQVIAHAHHHEDMVLALRGLLHELTALLGNIRPYTAEAFNAAANAEFVRRSPRLAAMLEDGTVELSIRCDH